MNAKAKLYVDRLSQILRGLQDDTDGVASYAGGTLSAMYLQFALRIQKEAKAITPTQTKQLTKIIAAWREALKRHNAQKLKFIEYDPMTGRTKRRRK